LILLLALGACGQSSISEGDPQSISDDIQHVITGFDGDQRLVSGYVNALYRAVAVPEFVEIPENFSVDVPIPLATDRPAQPAVASTAYVEKVVAGIHRISGMTPQMIVDLYVSQDSGLLGRQEAWIRRWMAETRIKTRNSVQEIERRRGLLDRFRAIRPSYFWDKGHPFLKMTVFNPLDVPLDRIAFDMDLFDQHSPERMGTASVQGSMTTPLQPGSEVTLTIDLTQYDGLNRPQFRQLPEAYGLRIKFRNAWSGAQSLIDVDSFDDRAMKLRVDAITDLSMRIRAARENLSRYRVLFDKESG
jgi:hypothetical protein